MTKKTLGFGQGIISPHTRDIDSEGADERPVGGSIEVLKGCAIFAKNHILNKRAIDSQFPSVHESKSANAAAEVTNELM